MCGIAGIINFNGKPADKCMIQKITDTMAHRGPDADGFYVDDEVALGHRRLAIIDLSAAANQPFSDNSGRYKIIFNGEMYNYAEVKPLLSDYDFKTTSDTEALIAAYAKWGPDCLGYFRGMFAFAIWDNEEKEIFIARDRMGVKPLYYYLDEEKLIFASEVRAILSTGFVNRKVNSRALQDYFSYQSMTYPYSAVEDIQQLEAGCWMKVRKGKLLKKKYWDLTNIPVNFDFTDKKRTEIRIKELLLQSVKRRLVSDVPVGAFLSGGIDSSVVVGLMAEADSAKPNTFNICFEEKEFDESRYAEIIAKKFNTSHTRILLKPEFFLDELIPALDAMDSPTADGINTYVVSKAIRQKGVIVALSGVGGDELFAGYPYFNQFLQLQNKKWIWKLPRALRQFSGFSKGGKIDRIGQIIGADSCNIENVYPVFRQILTPNLLKRLTRLADDHFTTSLQQELLCKKENLHRLPLLSQVSAAEYLGYTQHTLLKDTDQMSMAFSLEVREPFFDQDLVEFLLAVPDQLKKPIYPKSLLVESVKPLLPEEIVFRKKQGFLFPWSVWMKKELFSFCDKQIKNICQRSFINGKALNEYWQRFIKGDSQIRWPELWLFVVLEYWMEKNSIE
ncbi:MAG TPA: asparagine synthase (glutamine-hydrolyzing) [Puia sp.]|nr:asparagine synthase (glutamine-hydrolyzing) [Puia sp.]